jgi:HAD superfamily hydrolase (TIGR01484 family)
MASNLVRTPRAWSTVSSAELAGIRGVCLDIDETLTTRGKLSDAAYTALAALKRAGFAVVPITGRPAGWCDHIARFWPVDAVVGENGAFTFFMQEGVRCRITTPGALATPEEVRAKLGALGEKIRARFPHAKWASDQAYREYDLAIDYCEDVPPWPRNDLDELLALCEQEGAQAKLSSIHVNAWYGDYDKVRGFRHWLEQGAPGLLIKGTAPTPQEWLFIGDSPNDEPMFATVKYTVGVANLKSYLGRLKSPPLWITDAESGAGFVEMAYRLTVR